MAITFVRSAAGTAAAGSTITVTAPAAGFTTGDFLVLACSCADNTFNVSSITDSASNSYSIHSATRITLGGTAQLICSGYLTTGLTSGQTITVTLAAAVGGAVEACEFSSVASSSAFDKATAASIAFDTAFTTGNTATTTQADELLFGINFANSNARTFVPTGSFTEITDAAYFSWRMQTQYRVVSATGAYASTATADSATAGLASIATYKAALGVDTGLAWIVA